MKTRNPILGEWELCACLGRRREYFLYRGRHCTSGQEAHLRVLPPTADAEARECFSHAVSLASANPEYFLPVTSVRACGAGIIAVSVIPERTLAGAPLSPSIGQLATLCRGLAAGLDLVHRIGRIHAYLVPESVEVVGQGPSDVQLRLLDIGRGFAVGRGCAVEADSDLPPEASEDKVANVSWDIYAFGRLGQHLLRQAHASGAAEGVRLALEGLLQACSSTREQRRPRSMRVVADCLRDIVQQTSSAEEAESSDGRKRAPHNASSGFCHSLASPAAAEDIEASRSMGLSQSGRIVASLLSLAAVTALGFALASMVGVSVLSL